MGPEVEGVSGQRWRVHTALAEHWHGQALHTGGQELPGRQPLAPGGRGIAVEGRGDNVGTSLGRGDGRLDGIDIGDDCFAQFTMDTCDQCRHGFIIGTLSQRCIKRNHIGSRCSHCRRLREARRNHHVTPWERPFPEPDHWGMYTLTHCGVC